MTRQLALKILGLSSDFTKEELNNAYRKKVLEHHPDKFANIKEKLEHRERMQEINEAFEFLKKNKEFDLENYRSEMINKIKSYYQNLSMGLNNIIKEVKKAAEICENLIYSRSSKAGVDDVWKMFLQQLKKIYITYEFLFYRDNYIDYNEVRETLNYNVNVDDFYIQLCKIERKYSKSYKFNKRVKDEIAKYRLYATCNDQLWELITKSVVHNAEILAKKSGYREIEEPIRLMHKEIEDLFKLVDNINEKMMKIENFLKNINSEELNKELEKIKNGYGKESLFDTISSLEKLEKRIDEYMKVQKRQRRMQKESDIVNKLYKRLITDYSKLIMKLNPVTEEKKIRELAELFQNVMDLFTMYRDGYLGLDKLLILSELVFRDSSIDEKILNAINNIKNNSLKKSKIYLKKGFGYKFLHSDNMGFFVLSEEKGKYFVSKVSDDVVSEKKEITLEELNEYYVPLNEVMNGAIYQGFLGLYLNSLKVIVLYEIKVGEDYRYIILNDENIMIVERQTLFNLENFIGYEFNDKEALEKLIEEQVNSKLNSQNCQNPKR